MNVGNNVALYVPTTSQGRPRKNVQTMSDVQRWEFTFLQRYAGTVDNVASTFR
jgi:hypothetical protein